MPQQRQQNFILIFNVATVLLWAAFVYAFATKQSIVVPWSLVDLYLIVLTLYATDKEIRRWRHGHRSTQHRGEYITLGWIVTLVFMMGVEVAGGGKEGFKIPAHLPLAVGGILALYLITQYLKAEFRGFEDRPKRRVVRARKKVT